jgi:hypothetical protein
VQIGDAGEQGRYRANFLFGKYQAYVSWQDVYTEGSLCN